LNHNFIRLRSFADQTITSVLPSDSLLEEGGCPFFVLHGYCMAILQYCG